MDIGMLWLDDDKNRSLEEKVKRAAQYYRDKYGRKPNVCFINKIPGNDSNEVDKITIVQDKTILPHHFFLGLRSQ